MKDKIRSLTDRLNVYRNEYYNKNNSLITDKEYDELFDRLKELEEKFGIIFPDSPTQSVGYEVKSNLNKVEHNHPMLSLDKTKDIKEIAKFLDKQPAVVMAKMDGLTCSVRYVDGVLVSAETRGNGEVGEDITHNARVISNLPKHINHSGEVIIDGEVIICQHDFEEINSKLLDEEKYSHCRNLAAGSIRQLDSSISASRKLKFVAWKYIVGSETNSFHQRWTEMKHLGFECVPIILIENNYDTKELDIAVESVKKQSEENGYPIDGCVFGYNDIAYGDAKGRTEHHLLSQMAYKFYDEEVTTILRDVEWNVGKSGMVAPTAVFDAVDLDGAITTRATLHNLSIMKELAIGIGDEITIIRANQVIPKVQDNHTRSGTYKFPTVCPCCGSKLTLKNDTGRETLYCENDNCSAKILSKLEHFVSRSGMNIDGLSESTLEKFVDVGFIKNYRDIYHLSDHADEIKKMDGFGEKSCEKLLKSIEKSRHVKFENFLVSLGIPLIGKTASKTIAKILPNGTWDDFMELLVNKFDFSTLDDFGEAMCKSLEDFYNTAHSNPLLADIASEMIFEEKQQTVAVLDNFITGKTFCVTGAFNTMKRSEIEKIITDMGGKLTGSVSKKTDYLLTNEADSGSSKAKKAQELGTPIMSEIEFKKRLNVATGE